MKYKELVTISAFTGVLLCDFDDMHAYVEELLGRSVFTHEMGSDKLYREIKEKSLDAVKQICDEAKALKEV